MTVKSLSHKGSDFRINVEGKSQSAILNEIKAAGLMLSAKNLSKLLKGEVAEAGDFKGLKSKAHVAAETSPADKLIEQGNAIVAGNSAPTTAPTDAAPANTEVAPPTATQTPVAAAAAQTAAPAAAKAVRAKGPSLWERIQAAKAHPAVTAQENLTEEQKALIAKTEAEQGTVAKVSYKGTNWDAPGVLPQAPVAVLRDSKLHKLFEFLTKEGGVTKEQCCAEFGWSAGGFAGIIHWEPKAKGYQLLTEKKDGKIHYSLGYKNSNGKKVEPGSVVVRDKVVAAPKAPKAPKAPAAVKTPKVRVPADGMAQAGAAMNGGNAAQVTTRVAAKKS
jgi:hypothetical protein